MEGIDHVALSADLEVVSMHVLSPCSREREALGPLRSGCERAFPTLALGVVTAGSLARSIRRRRAERGAAWRIPALDPQFARLGVVHTAAPSDDGVRVDALAADGSSLRLDLGSWSSRASDPAAPATILGR